MTKIKQFFKTYYKFLIIYVAICLILLIPLPYYIYAPGGLININDRVSIKDSYASEGSFNLSYVSEYKGNILTCVIGFFNKNWDVLKRQESRKTVNNYNYIDRLSLEEAYNNATIVSYRKAHKKVEIVKTSVYVQYVFEDSHTNLQIGDRIISLDGVKVTSLDDVNEVVSHHKKGDILNVKVSNRDKTYKRSAKLIEYKGSVLIGIGVLELNEVSTKPHISFNYSNDEYGPSGGLMLSLNIYNMLVKKDITKGYTIVGTGTIDKDGNVGKIDGVEYKIKGALKKKVDLFIVPKDNLKEALRVKRRNHYDINIVGVSTFTEALEYLDKLKSN